MFLSTLVKNTGLLVVGVIIASLAIFFSSNYFMHRGYEDIFRKNLDTMRRVVEDNLFNLKDRLAYEVNLLSRSQELKDAFHRKDARLLSELLRPISDNLRTSFITLTDASGKVVLRSHSLKTGDNISDSILMHHAMEGKTSVDVVRLKNNGLSIAAASPIIQDQEIIGVLLLGEAFSTHAFVDEIRRVTDLEVTVFDHDLRLSTTLIRDGERAVGTRLDNQGVATTVLQDGGVFNADANILGKAYKTVYWPLRDNQRHILGMWFIGTEVDDLEAIIRAVALSCLGTTMLLAIGLSIFGVFFLRALINPLERRAYIDNLTGITNRAGFERAFQSTLISKPGTGAVFLIDLDNFKQVNDTFGHPVGDECLKRTAGILKKIFRETDIVARLGGDEFIVYAPTLQYLELIRLKAREILTNVQYRYNLKDSSIRVTTSIGIAIYPRDGDSYKTLYHNADLALYEAKMSKKNTFFIFGEDDGENGTSESQQEEKEMWQDMQG